MTTPLLPAPDPDSVPFWAACREGRLIIQCCPVCDEFRWPPMEFCPHCHHDGAEWEDLPGTGTIAAFVVARRAFNPAFAERIPYVVAHIALDGAPGVNLISNVLANAEDELAVGQCVTVEFFAAGEMTLHRFRPHSYAAEKEDRI